MMNFKENNKAIFIQIADRICDEILSGDLVSGQRIPSVRVYASSIEVNSNTVMRAYEYLASREILFNKRGIGFFVADDARGVVDRMRRSDFIEGELEDVFKQLALLGVGPDELKEKYNSYLKTNQNK